MVAMTRNLRLWLVFLYSDATTEPFVDRPYRGFSGYYGGQAALGVSRSPTPRGG